MSAFRVLLSPPEVSEVERQMLLDAFDSGWVAPAGPDLDAFERELAEFTGARAVAGLSSGTAALHLALMGVGVAAGDDVLVSTLTFGASAFAVTYLGARPCFIDCDPLTWHLDPDLLEQELERRAATSSLPAAVLSVHLYGAVADSTRVASICARFGVPLVEDAAEALGAYHEGVHSGRAGRVAVLSFNGNKIVTTGGGGAVMSDDEEFVQKVRHRATQARRPVPWYEHDEIGFNYRMGNLNAAVGRGQLRTLPARIAERRRVRLGYEHHLGHLPGVSFQHSAPESEPNHWLTTVRFAPDEFGASPADVVAALRAEGIEARHGFKPMHQQPVFADSPVVGGSVADDLFASTVSLPSGGRLTDEQVEWISEVIASTSR